MSIQQNINQLLSTGAFIMGQTPIAAAAREKAAAESQRKKALGEAKAEQEGYRIKQAEIEKEIEKQEKVYGEASDELQPLYDELVESETPTELTERIAKLEGPESLTKFYGQRAKKLGLSASTIARQKANQSWKDVNAAQKRLSGMLEKNWKEKAAAELQQKQKAQDFRAALENPDLMEEWKSKYGGNN